MTPTNANDPFHTTDHDPSAAKRNRDVTADYLPSSSPTDDETGAYRPEQSTEPKGAMPERVLPAISVPGYAIESVLGRGGMGVVYKAQHLALRRTVAIKMVLAGGHAGPRELARFRIEAEAVARLQHPIIVQIHEVGEADGYPYCALEFVEGGNLASKLNAKSIPAREAAQLIVELARAMQLAHSRNVVHRDLKPANILLTADGTPKITDFGIARQMDRESGETQAGVVMGTPSYMAPEQASGRAHDAGPAADVYSLGAILYVCLTGRPPFKGKTVVETLDQVRTTEPVPPSRYQASVPLDLETICLKCLRKEPEERYASAAELADELRRYQRGEPILARPVSRIERAVKWVKRNPVVAGSAAAVVLALAIGVTVSYLKYLDAEKQKAIAEARTTDAQKSAADAVAARKDVELTNDNLVTTVAESYIRTLGVQVRSNQWFPGLNDPEVAALWEVGDSKDERLRLRFVAQALRDPGSTHQFTDRAAFALQAAVGLDGARRTQVEELLGQQLLANESPQEQQEDVTICLGHLGVRDRLLAEKTVAVLTQAMSRTFEAARLTQLSESLLAVVARMEPKGAAAVLSQVISKTTDPGGSVKGPLGEGLSAVVATMEPKQAAAILTQAMNNASDPRAMLPLARGLAGVVARMDAKDAAPLLGQFATKFTHSLSTSTTSEATRDLALGLSYVAARMDAKEANQACVEAAGYLTTAMAKIPHVPWLKPLSEGVLALSAFMDPKEANKACGQAAATLIKAIPTGFGGDLQTLTEVLPALTARMEPKEAVAALTQAMQTFTPQQVQFFSSDGPTPFDTMSRALSAVATRMEPKDAADTAVTFTQAISKSMEPRSMAGLAQGLSVVADRMDPKEAAQVCAPIAAALSQAMNKPLDPLTMASLSKGMSAVAVRMEPKEAVSTLTQAMSKTTDPSVLVAFVQGLSVVAARMEPKEAAATLTELLSKTKDPGILAALAQGLSAVVTRMKPEDAAPMCCQVAAVFTVAISKSTELYALRSLALGLSAVAPRMEPKEANQVCGQAAAILSEAITKFTTSFLTKPRRTDVIDLSDTRPMNALQLLGEGLSAVAACMNPQDATRICGRVGVTLTQAMNKSTHPNAFVLISDLSASMSLVAARMESKEAAVTCGQAAAILYLALKKHSSAPDILRSLSKGLAGMSVRMEPKEAATILIQAMSKFSRTNPNESESLKLLSDSLSVVVTREASPLSSQSLVEILKHPLCVGESRLLVLDRLSRHYNRRFADQWEFVEYVQQQNLDVDVSTPPQRFKQVP